MYCMYGLLYICVYVVRTNVKVVRRLVGQISLLREFYIVEAVMEKCLFVTHCDLGTVNK